MITTNVFFSRCRKNCHTASKQGHCLPDKEGTHVCKCATLPSVPVVVPVVLLATSSSSRKLRAQKALGTHSTHSKTPLVVQMVAAFPGQHWTGIDCGELSCPLHDGETCGGNGKCIQGQCYCDPLHIGLACELSSCPASCSNHGTCVLHVATTPAQPTPAQPTPAQPTTTPTQHTTDGRTPKGPVVTGASQPNHHVSDGFDGDVPRVPRVPREAKGPVLTGSKHSEVTAALLETTTTTRGQPTCDCEDGYAGTMCETKVCPGAGNCNARGTSLLYMLVVLVVYLLVPTTL
jgi:hypothetical protein